uniref:Uncharacterized protein n=1 Tax=Nymphaea colorata TaxID=210225 RepID=A0A5K1GG43_9MAGN
MSRMTRLVSCCINE